MIGHLKAQIAGAHEALRASESECQAAALDALDALNKAELMRSSEKEDVFKKAAARHLQASENWKQAVENQKKILEQLYQKLDAARMSGQA